MPHLYTHLIHVEIRLVSSTSAFWYSCIFGSCDFMWKNTTIDKNPKQCLRKQKLLTTKTEKNGSNLKGKEDTIEWRTMHIFLGFTFPSPIKRYRIGQNAVQCTHICANSFFTLLSFVCSVCIVCTEQKQNQCFFWQSIS